LLGLEEGHAAAVEGTDAAADGDEGGGPGASDTSDDAWLDDLRDIAEDADAGFDDSGSDDPEDSSTGAAGQAGAGAAAGSSSRSSMGRIEPGVLAMSVRGGMLACVDTLGNVLVRDFATGTAEQVQRIIVTNPGQEAAGRAPDGRDAAAGGAGSDAAGAAGGTMSQQQGDEGGDIPASKFWRV
jgi:hypothetical protein